MEDKPIKGNCIVCGTRYNMQIYEVVVDERFADYVTHPCPKCKYDPHIKEQIKHAIERDFKLTLTSKHAPSINSKELSDVINEIIKEYWPKNKK